MEKVEEAKLKEARRALVKEAKLKVRRAANGVNTADKLMNVLKERNKKKASFNRKLSVSYKPASKEESKKGTTCKDKCEHDGSANITSVKAADDCNFNPLDGEECAFDKEVGNNQLSSENMPPKEKSKENAHEPPLPLNQTGGDKKVTEVVAFGGQMSIASLVAAAARKKYEASSGSSTNDSSKPPVSPPLAQEPVNFYPALAAAAAYKKIQQQKLPTNQTQVVIEETNKALWPILQRQLEEEGWIE